MKENTFSFLENAAMKWGSRTAIVEGNKRSIFKDLNDLALALCLKLEAAAHVKGKGIGFVCSNGSRFVSGLFACAKAGAVAMPILRGTKEKEIEELLNESQINILVAEKGNGFSFRETVLKTSLSGEFDLFVFQEIIPSQIDSVFHDAAFIRPSSGTTGSSKGVVISHRSVFERTEAANEGLMLDENCIMLWVMPMAFHFIVSVLLYVRYGVCMIISENFSARTLVQNANEFLATHLYASPLHYRLLASEKSDLKFETLKVAVSTSAHLEASVSKIFFEKYKLPVSQAYGIIEIGLPFINSETGNYRSESVGKVLPKYTAVILDDNMKEVKRGMKGAFAIKGPGMFSGYLWPMKKVEDVLVNSWFLTGDIAEMDEDGFVFVKGRSKSMINVSGNKVFPEEVEAVLKLHPGIADARAYAGRHPVTGEIVQAEVVLKTEKNGNEEEIISMCREQLLPYKVPQKIFFVKEIAKTKTGKISRA